MLASCFSVVKKIIYFTIILIKPYRINIINNIHYNLIARYVKKQHTNLYCNNLHLTKNIEKISDLAFPLKFSLKIRIRIQYNII